MCPTLFSCFESLWILFWLCALYLYCCNYSHLNIASMLTHWPACLCYISSFWLFMPDDMRGVIFHLLCGKRVCAAHRLYLQYIVSHWLNESHRSFYLCIFFMRVTFRCVAHMRWRVTVWFVLICLKCVRYSFPQYYKFQRHSYQVNNSWKGFIIFTRHHCVLCFKLLVLMFWTYSTFYLMFEVWFGMCHWF